MNVRQSSKGQRYQPVTSETERQGNKGMLLRIARKLDVQILTKLFWCMGGSRGKRKLMLSSRS